MCAWHISHVAILRSSALRLDGREDASPVEVDLFAALHEIDQRGHIHVGQRAALGDLYEGRLLDTMAFTAADPRAVQSPSLSRR